MICKNRPPAYEKSTMTSTKMQASLSDGKQKNKLAGAPRFELGTSCAQGSRSSSWKSFLFNRVFENKRVRKIFGSGTMYGNVAAHAWSPPNFPHSETTTKVLRSVLASTLRLKLNERPVAPAEGLVSFLWSKCHADESCSD
jgi:hypothetical protein